MKYALTAFALVAAATATTTSSAAPSVPTPGQTCTGNSAYCGGPNSNIILRCTDGKIVAGNCNDNAGEPNAQVLCSSMAPSSATCSVVASSTSAAPSVPTPGQSCSGSASYCAGSNTNIILRCESGKIVAGNCNDNAGEPNEAVLCSSMAPSSATCSVVSSTTSSSAATSVPTPGQSCTGESAFCAGSNSPIILRCSNGKLQPGNCNDNLNEPSQGALCNSFAANTATCSAVGSSASATATGSSSTNGTTNAGGMTTPAATMTATRASSSPISTGAAARGMVSWSEVAGAVAFAAWVGL